MNIILFQDIPKFISLTDPRGTHIKKILKLQPGDSFKAGILNGPIGEVLIRSAGPEGYQVEWRQTGPPVGLYPLTLLVGFVRPISAKRILREAASLGVARLLFTVTDTGERSYRQANLWKKGAYREYLINGLQTAGATMLPRVELYDRLGDAIAAVETDAAADGPEGAEAGPRGPVALGGTAGPARPAGLFQPRGARGPEKLLLDNISEGSALKEVEAEERELILAVGSERGWSEAERARFLKAGYRPVHIGRRILRTETACSAGAALALSKMGFI